MGMSTHLVTFISDTDETYHLKKNLQCITQKKNKI